jgi:hypothetical protein
MNTIVNFLRPHHDDKLYQVQLAKMERRMMWAVQEVIDQISREYLREMMESE